MLRRLATVFRPAAPAEPVGATAADETLMRRAMQLARDAAAMGETPVGAVVARTDTGEILAEAHNRRETDHDPAGHAELIALRAAARRLGDWRLHDCTLAVTLEPCPMCAGLIVQSRLGRLVYGAPDPKAGAVASLYELCSDPRLNHRLTPIAGVLADESAELLRSFFKELRAKKKR